MTGQLVYDDGNRFIGGHPIVDMIGELPKKLRTATIISSAFLWLIQHFLMLSLIEDLDFYGLIKY